MDKFDKVILIITLLLTLLSGLVSLAGAVINRSWSQATLGGCGLLMAWTVIAELRREWNKNAVR